MIPVICPVYLPNVYYCNWILNQPKVFFVVDSHYQKQTFRNRTEIYGANGKLKLTIPVENIKSQNNQKDPDKFFSDQQMRE